jgi:hypothetical protein
MVVLGLRVAVAVARITPPDVFTSGLAPNSFMLVPIVIILTFAIYATVGLWKRRRSEIHRPMMLLAALAAMPAPIGRINAINVLYVGTVWERRFGEFFGTLVVGAFLLGMKWLLTRAFDRWFAMGYAALLIASMLTMRLATSGAWERIAAVLLR